MEDEDFTKPQIVLSQNTYELHLEKEQFTTGKIWQTQL